MLPLTVFMACHQRLMVWCCAGLQSSFLISLHRPFLRVTNHTNPLKPACTIPCVVCWPFLFIFIICHFYCNVFLSVRWSGKGWKALWQNLVEALALCVLPMCVLAKVRCVQGNHNSIKSFSTSK